MRITLTVGACLAALSLAGCPNPNAIGVQKYGTIAATAVLSSSGQPVANAEVIVNSTQYCNTHADGTCQIPMVPIGPQVVYAVAPGLASDHQPVNVQENQISPVTLQMTAASTQ
jgi:hypothetical protein